jgi:hypothetical protein
VGLCGDPMGHLQGRSNTGELNQGYVQIHSLKINVF